MNGVTKDILFHLCFLLTFRLFHVPLFLYRSLPITRLKNSKEKTILHFKNMTAETESNYLCTGDSNCKKC